MTSDALRVSVVIPVFGREDVFATVALLRSQPYAKDLRFVIVDNGNAPELSARLAALGDANCRVIRFADNRGGSAAYIAGMGHALSESVPPDFVWLLDDDAVPDAETLPRLVRTMEDLLAHDARVASVGSVVMSARTPDEIVECGAGFSPLLGRAFPRLRGRRRADVGDVVLQVPYAAACSLLVNPAAVRACGFWEDVFIHFDDIEWGLRVSRAGWRNYATTASAVVHPDFNPEKAGPWICYFDARNLYWLASKFGPVHVAAAWLKNALKNLSGRHPERAPYRRLAWSDYKAGVRRTRSSLPRDAATRLTVFVAAHKPYPMPVDEIYRPIHVGASGGSPIADWQRDDEGENISSRNANWCELTALYWAWKHAWGARDGRPEPDLVGLVHYRRHFRGRRGTATGAEIRRALGAADALLPRKRNYFIETNYSQYVHAHHAQDLDVTRRILVERYPDYVDSFDAVMRSASGHRFNMFVFRRAQADAYCAWLFDVLFELERRLDISAYSAYDARVFGFVAERLLDVWISRHGLSVRELSVRSLESQHWPKKILRFVCRKFCHRK